MAERKITLPLILNALFLLGLVAILLSSIFIFRPQAEQESFLNVNEELVKQEEYLTPSLILNKKGDYAGERLIIRGRVSQSPVVCSRQDCPEDDSCCGCPNQRDLVMSDPSISIKAKSKQSLKLLTINNDSLCERRSGSCDYDCPGFKEGAIYDVVGEFVADAPPPGWNLSLNFYFKVNNQELVKKVSLGETISNLFNEITQSISKSKTSGQYVLQ